MIRCGRWYYVPMPKDTKTYLVIPTIRNLEFLSSWGEVFADCHLVVVEDGPKVGVKIPNNRFLSTHHYSWNDIDGEFKSDAWIFSRRNAGIRSYGFWKSYQLGAEWIITLDDDCYPVDPDFVSRHVQNLSLRAPTGWTATFPHPDYMFTRGIPYEIRNKQKVVVSHGLWTNKIDLDAQTEIHHPNLNLPSYPPFLQFIPKGVYFPMCSMNLAFHRIAVPMMYFPPMGSRPDGSPWGFDRFDDIWAGIFVKKICDHLGYSIANGSPFVEHRKASNVQKNLEKEKEGILFNEKMWQLVEAVSLTKHTPAACYLELAQKINFPKKPYFISLQKAMTIWASLF
jgi:hypothetical protein